MRHFRLDGVKIKTPSKIEAMRKAGCLSAQALEAVGSFIAPGVTTAELDARAEQCIRLAGGTPAFKGYGGFPATICASINDMVVHGIPSEHVVLKEGDIVSIDTGALVNGWVGDNAATFAVGAISDEDSRLIETTKAALMAGIEQAVSGNHLGDIGHAVQEIAEQAGFGVVRDYAGHGIGRAMHESPIVRNFGEPGTGLLLEVGMVLAIEPMLTAGTFRVKTIDDGWGAVTCDHKASAHFEHTVAITEDGPLILTVSQGK
jgi:methionyl aminopeptidase